MILYRQPVLSLARYLKELGRDLGRLRLARANRALVAVQACVMAPNEYTAGFVAAMRRRQEVLTRRINRLEAIHG